jgi:hypothetical protein
MSYYFENTRFPASLYKFRSFDMKGHNLTLLSHNELFFAASSRFNDPFDSKIPISYISDSRNEIINFWTKQMQVIEPGWSKSARRKRIEELFEDGKITDQGFIENAKLHTEQVGSRLFGIFSLAGSPSNILLWSHYSDSHSGFAVGFQTSELRKMSASNRAKMQKGMILLPIQYSKEFPLINGYKHTREERFRLQQLTKAKDWEYEQEFRILLQNGPDTIVRFPNNVFKRVLLGCNITETDRNIIIKILREREDRLNLYQAQRSKNKFGLTFSKVNY